MPEERPLPALGEAVSMLRAVAPHLDATALAEALWLASRAAPAPAEASEPDATPPAPPAPAGTADPRTDPDPRTARPPTPSGQAEGGPARTLHERLPGSGTRVTGHAVALPRASALPHTLELTRALRPWKRSWRTGRDQALDVSATVDAYARSGELIPVFAPAPERWFDLVLVVDDSPSMQVWRETVHAFTGVLDRLGAFRTLQVRHFHPDSGNELTDPEGRSASAGQLGAPDGRRLVVVVSDCAAPAWRAPEIWQQVRSWAHGTPVALLNPLPPKLWRRTGLDLPTVRVTQQVPGTGNAGLDFRPPPLLPRDSWLPVPVLSLSPHSLGRWSRAVMLAAPDGCSAALIPAAGRPEVPGRPEPTAPRRVEAGTSEAGTERFLRTASPAAARLAVLCSPFDRLSLDMLHVLRAEHVAEATTADVAEVVSSGVFTLEAEPGGQVVLRASPQVRARLEQELPEHEALRLSRTLNHHLASGHDGLRRLLTVAEDADGGEAVAAEATPLGVALSRTLELLGLVVERPVAGPDAPAPVVLDDPTGHEPWLHEDGRRRQWAFWERFLRHLAVGNWPPDAVDRLNSATDAVLSRLEDPRRPGHWQRSGLVVTGVGTGRTSHAVGLAAKAVDAGYGAIVVLTGPTNAERRQTQSRVDEWLLSNGSPVRPLDILSLTTQNDEFSSFRTSLPPPAESVPLVFVIKKNRRVVDRVRDWLARVSPPTDRPLLVIDLANTSSTAGKSNPSVTARSVLRLVGGFRRTAYVRYESFLPALDASGPPELFPDHFIYHLPAPSDHLDPRPPLGASVREVTDHETWMPDRHRSGHVPPEGLPASLREAINTFVLACAARRARGRAPAPDSMLVYVSNFVAVQDRVRHQVAKHIQVLADTLRKPDSTPALRLRDQLASLWFADPRAASWDEVSAHITPAVQGLAIVRVSDDRPGAAVSPGVVAICGPRVPPDLRNGLAVSYQLRSSNDYAMFVHSNHWSDGVGDEDRRLYAPPAVLSVYEHLITFADEQLRGLRDMAGLGVTPRQSALWLRPAGPRRAAEDFSGTSVETLSFDLSPAMLHHNFQALENFVHVLDHPGSDPLSHTGRNLLWMDVPPQTVLQEFLDVYRPHTRPDRKQLDLVCAYVRRCVARGELTRWAVQLVRKAGASESVSVAGHFVGPVVRRAVVPDRPGTYTVRRLLSPVDQFGDLDMEQYAAALDLTRSASAPDRRPTRPSTQAMRAVRRPDQPLLTIYPVAPPVEGAEDPVPPVVGFVLTFPYTRGSGGPHPEDDIT
ncbi:regulatory protein [Streptomyces lincolnensis]|uniref:Regulatory protein n=1 Tax=Streptomyces lincolnensis TaxID=1915 RepID=A0A1B1MLS9_STRLN|nr:regulatory protein [Streptomyces lincolnensis]